MQKKLRYGQVGGDLKAFIGDVHRKAIGFDTRAELACGCFSVEPELNIECAERYNVDPARVYMDYREMAAAESSREDGIDFVSICTPNFLHYEISKTFLLHGINVVCEKPLCFTVEEAEELVRLAKERDLVFAVTYGYTGYTLVKVMKEMIAKGYIGDIVAINAEYAQDWMLQQLANPNATDEKVWRTDPKYTGISNCVADIGTHLENMVHYITGFDIKRLSATVNRYGKPLDYNANILVEYTNGVNGAYWCSQVANARSNDLMVRIYGLEGALEWTQERPDELRYAPKNGVMQTIMRGWSYLPEKSAGTARLPIGHPEGFYEAFANIYKNVISLILKKKNGEPLNEWDYDFPSAVDGMCGVKFVHAVMESADHDSKWVTLHG